MYDTDWQNVIGPKQNTANVHSEKVDFPKSKSSKMDLSPDSSTTTSLVPMLGLNSSNVREYHRRSQN